MLMECYRRPKTPDLPNLSFESILEFTDNDKTWPLQFDAKPCIHLQNSGDPILSIISSLISALE
jgi:hypothetical protein